MSPKHRSTTSTKSRIVDAAEKIISKRGLARATTKEIAKTAACAEGTLYVHFRNQMQIFAAVFERRLPAAADALKTLQAQAGKGDVTDNLVAALLGVAKFLEEVMPILAGALADPALGKAFRATWSEFGFGPENFIVRLTSFVRSEQERGRIPSGTKAEIASEALVGFLFYSAFTVNLLKAGEETVYEGLLYDIVRANIFGPPHRRASRSGATGAPRGRVRNVPRPLSAAACRPSCIPREQ
jgi:AcrR family transcriptional regulator